MCFHHNVTKAACLPGMDPTAAFWRLDRVTVGHTCRCRLSLEQQAGLSQRDCSPCSWEASEVTAVSPAGGTPLLAASVPLHLRGATRPAPPPLLGPWSAVRRREKVKTCPRSVSPESRTVRTQAGARHSSWASVSSYPRPKGCHSIH